MAAGPPAGQNTDGAISKIAPNRGDPDAKEENLMRTSSTAPLTFKLTPFSSHPSGASLPEQHY